jgi:D-alanine-D-alanine ligase
VIPLGDGPELLRRLLDDPPDFVFNFAEGQGVGRSREARVPAVLEMLGIPYTGSDPLTMAVTLDKDCAKRLVRSAGVSVPDGFVCPPDADPAALVRGDTLRHPYIVKPAWEGSSKGIKGKCVVETRRELIDAVRSLQREQRQPVLVEEFIAGEELTVGLIGNAPPQVLGILRVIPLQATERFVYSLEVKRDWQRRVRYESPARLRPAQADAVARAARTVFDVLGCRDVARIDFRLRGDEPYFLEVNPLPGLSPETSDLFILCRGTGWNYDRLVGGIFEAACVRHGIGAGR